MNALDIVQDLENYLSKNALDSVVKDMMVQCLHARPEKPLSWMMSYILKQNAGMATSDCSVANTSDMFVALSNQDSAVQQYLTEKKVHLVLLELVKKIVEDKPDNVLSFVATTAHNLHKTPPPGLQ